MCASVPKHITRPSITHHIPAAYGVHWVHMCASVPKHITRLTTATTTRPSITHHIPAAYGVHWVHMCASVPKHITRLTTATTTRPSITHHIPVAYGVHWVLSYHMTPVTQAIQSSLIIVQTNAECCFECAHMSYRMFHRLAWDNSHGLITHIPVSSSPSHRSRFDLAFRKNAAILGIFHITTPLI